MAINALPSKELQKIFFKYSKSAETKGFQLPILIYRFI